MSFTSSAFLLARQFLAADMPERFAHVVGVAARARWVAAELGLDDAVEDAAWLHDIGYAQDLVDTGFHPLDGARYLRDFGVNDRIASLVARHSCSHVEAEKRGLLDVLTHEFPLWDPLYADALCYCDMTTGPRGERVTVEARVNEILERYDTGSVVYAAISEARPQLIQAVRRTQGRMAVQFSPSGSDAGSAGSC